MKYVITASTRESLSSKVDELYSAVCDRFESSEIADEVLTTWGANESDNGPEGYLTGVSEDQMRGMISDFQKLLKSEGELLSHVVFDDATDIETLYEAVYGYVHNCGPHTKDELYYLNRVLGKLRRS